MVTIHRSITWSLIMSPPIKWGDILFLAPLSVCPSKFAKMRDDVQCLCLTKVGQGHNLWLNIEWLYFESALYFLNPWLDLQFCLHTRQLWWDDVQCLCLTKVGSRSRSQTKIKHCMTIFRVRSISFEPLVGFTSYFAQMSAMMGRCAVPMLDQGRFKVKVTV